MNKQDEECKQFVQDAAFDLSQSVEKALAEFTRITGLCVSDVTFDVSEVRDDRGSLENCVYHNTRIRTVV